MTNQEHLKMVSDILKELDCRPAKPQDKIAALKSAAAIIENGLAAEMTFQIYSNALTKT